MKALVAEDYLPKSAQIRAAVFEAVPGIHIDCAYSYRGALDLVMSTVYDLVVLDITMPDFDERGSGSEIMHYAGKEILLEMVYQDRFSPTVIVTGFDVIGDKRKRVTFAQLKTELMSLIGSKQFDMVAYNAANPEWKLQFISAVRRVLLHEQTNPARRRRHQSQAKKNNGPSAH